VKHILFTFFIIGLTLSGFSQQDTTSALDILYKQSQDKAKEARKANYVGGAINVGIGYGGNKDKKGFARGLAANIHNRMHTINMYGNLATKSEEISSGFDYTRTLQSYNLGIMYGLGIYKEHVSLSGGVGVGYTLTNMILFDPSHQLTSNGNYYPGISSLYTPVTYSKTTGCAGAQLTFHGRFIGFTIQSYVNFSNTITNYVVMSGLTLMLK